MDRPVNNNVSNNRGQTILIPDLMNVANRRFTPTPISPFYESVLAEHNSWIEIQNISPTYSKHAQKMNATLLCASSFPEITRERLLNISLWTTFFFVLDDTFDNEMISEQESEDLVAYSEEMRSFFKWILGQVPMAGEVPEMRRSTSVFVPIIAHISESLSVQGRENFLNSMLHFLCTVDKTVHQFKSKQVEISEISIEQYLQDRIVEIGFGQYVVLFEYCYEKFEEFPDSSSDWIVKDKSFISAMHQCCTMAGIVNDLLSLPKEFESGEHESTVPLLSYWNSVSMSEAALISIEMLKSAGEDFLKFEKEFLNSHSEMSTKEMQQIKMVFDSCINLYTGTAVWSYGFERYLKGNQLKVDGQVRSFVV